MYKIQLTVQKIICFAALVVSAVVFVYALGLMTDMHDSLKPAMMDSSNIDDTWVPGAQIYYHMQPFNKTLLNYSIVMILLSCLLFITSTHSRRRYYIGNAVAVGAFAEAGVVLCVWSHIKLEDFKAEFLKVDFEELKFFSEMWGTPYIDSTFWFDAHYAVFGLMRLVVVLLIANYMWKQYLMRAEERLIEEGKKVSA